MEHLKTLLQILLIFNLFHFISLTKDADFRGVALAGAGTMEVKLIRAKDLKRSDGLFDRIEPYVVIKYRNEEHKSKTAYGRDPVWNEEFKFRVKFPAPVDKNNYNLMLQILDRDSYTKDDDLGQSKIYLKNMFEEGFEKGKSEIAKQVYRVVLGDLSYQGEIEVAITFTAKVPTN